MAILKRLKEEAKRVKRGFHVTTGIGLEPKEKALWKKKKYERDVESYKRNVEVLKRKAEVESLKTRIHKTKEARRPKRMGIRETPSMFMDDFSPVGFYSKQQKAAKKVKKVKRRKKKSKKKRRRVTEYY